MSPVPPCPDEQDLLRFALGQLPDPEAESIATHLNSCDLCSEKLKNLRPEDPLLNALRGPERELSEVPPVEAIVARVEAELRRGDPDHTTDLPAKVTSPHDEPVVAEGAIIAGKYILLEAIGEGGMGSVWRAQQIDPVKRFVAIKLIKAGMDSSAVLARFEAERQAIALMDHPNIAKIFDGGLHQNRPFFVMELVKGVPITQYCDALRLTPHQRLELFVPICNAIQHAHQKGIIHRDIKPSNVMVALYDDKPVPKVIDFGLAKATGGSLTEFSLNTAFVGVAGTPQYMSPEQATLNNIDIDTRSDIYSLGVLLYELLAGSPPFKRQELERAGLLEVLRVIREEEPPKPSTKLSSAKALPSLSANRGSEPKKLMGILRNELDWIVMKALEKDRGRRYETANGFAADVNRYLSGEAVHAHPPSKAYRLKKFLRKNRGPVIAASLLFLALSGGVIGTTLGLFEARRQEKEATDQKLIAQARLREFDKATDVTFSIFKDVDIRKVKTTEEPVEAVLAKRLIKTAKQLDAKAIADPLIVTKMQNGLAESLIALGYWEEAIQLLLMAVQSRSDLLGHDHRDTLESKENLAEAYKYAGKLDLSLPLFEETLVAMKSKLGPEDVTTLICMNNLAAAYQVAGKLDLALSLLEETFKIRTAKLGSDDDDTLASKINLAIGYKDAKKLDLALPLYEEAVKVMKLKHPDHPDTRTYIGYLAVAYQLTGKFNLAFPLFEESLNSTRAKEGSDHPETLTRMQGLASAYISAGKLDLAVPLLEETFKKRKVRLSPRHPDLLSTMNDLAEAYRRTKKLDLAVPLFEETLRAYREIHEAGHPDVLTGMYNLGRAYLDAGKLDLAIPLLEAMVQATEAKFGPNHPNTLDAMNILGDAYRTAKQFDKLIPLSEAFLIRSEATSGRQNPNTKRAVALLGIDYKAVGRMAEALPLLEEAYHASRDQPSLKFVQSQLLDAYLKGARSQEAEKFVQEELATARKTLPVNSPQMAAALGRFGLVLLNQKAFSQAETLLREAWDIDQKTQPDLWATFNMQSMLGGALLGQKKYAEAEPLLVKGYAGLKEREEKIPLTLKVRLVEALDRVIDLYTAMENEGEVKKWQEIKDKLPKTNQKK